MNVYMNVCEHKCSHKHVNERFHFIDYVVHPNYKVKI